MGKRILLFTSFCCLVFIFGEVVIRYSGFMPGVMYSNLNFTDSLYLKPTHFADSLGIWRGIPDTARMVNRQGFTSPYDFEHDLDSLRHSGQKVIMLIGDSYAEGRSTGDVKESFAWLIDKDPAYALLNFGEGGGDPLQYELITRYYLSSVKPDILIISFFLGNDIVYEERKPVPYRPILYETNAGNFIAEPYLYTAQQPNVFFKNMHEAYDFQLQKLSLRGRKNPAMFIISHSALLTRIYFRLFPPFINPILRDIRPKSSIHLRRIVEMARENRIKVKIVAVPGIEDVKGLNQSAMLKKYAKVFEDIPVDFVPIDSLSRTDYVSDANDHFSASGNRKMASFLLKVIKEK